MFGTLSSQRSGLLGPRALFACAVCLCLALVGALAISPAQAPAKSKKRDKTAVAGPCSPVPADKSQLTIPASDIWDSSAPYKFPFVGYTPKGLNNVIWKKITSSSQRKTDYPAPNLPSCRIGVHGTEDRTSRKAGQYMSTLRPIDGVRSYDMRDSFDRHVATIHWEDTSLIKHHPERWGWYVDSKWAGHGATRAFEVQGNACKLRPQTETVDVGTPPAPVTVTTLVRDQGWAMVAFNPALGSPNRKYRPNQTGALRVRAFVDKRALPGYALASAADSNFGCGQSALTPELPPSPLAYTTFESGYGPGRQYMIGQYFGESASPLDLLPGESKIHNNMPYDVYNPKPQFGNAAYAMNNTTGVAGGGMVRGVIREGVDYFTLYDEMSYCDPNYTLAGMVLRRNHKKVSKWNYFELANFSKLNKPTVRWVYGQITPNLSTLSPAMMDGAQNPSAQKLFAWMPIQCDR